MAPFFTQEKREKKKLKLTQKYSKIILVIRKIIVLLRRFLTTDFKIKLFHNH